MGRARVREQGPGQGLVLARAAAPAVQLVRVPEDLIDLLVERSVTRLTDLPPAAQEKLSARRSARVSMRSLNLLSERDGQIL